jgi:hypothetical protein
MCLRPPTSPSRRIRPPWPRAATSTQTQLSARSPGFAIATIVSHFRSPAARRPSSGTDTFVFNANFGHDTVANLHLDTDVIEIDHTIFADFQALLAAAHDDSHGNAVITADPHDTITLKDVTVAQLVQHQGDFHFT